MTSAWLVHFTARCFICHKQQNQHSGYDREVAHDTEDKPFQTAVQRDAAGCLTDRARRGHGSLRAVACVCCSRERGVCAATDREGHLTRDIKSTASTVQNLKLHQRIQFILNRMRLLQLCRVASRSSASIQQFSVNAIQDWLWPRRGGTSNLLLVIMPCCHHSYWTGKMTGVSLFIV